MHESVQFSPSVVSHSLRPHESQRARPPCLSLPEFTQTHVHRVGDAIQPSHPLLSLLLLLPIPPRIRVFSNESNLRMRWPEYWSFSVSIIPSNEPRTDLLYDGLVGFPCSPRDSQDFSPTHSSKASILWHSAFFTVQL